MTLPLNEHGGDSCPDTGHRFPRRIAGWVALLIGAAAVLGLTSSNRQTFPTVNPEVVRLIDRLTMVANDGVGVHHTATVSGFIAIDEEPQFEAGILGSKRPVTPPVMRELVAMGVDALPDLL